MDADRIIRGDCRLVLPTLAENSVHCVVTSPPFFRLRSYLPKGHPDKALEIGSEKTVSEYLDTLVGVFREVRRILRDDGVLFLEISEKMDGERFGVPERLVLALQADGWCWRDTIIFHKKAPMPESVSGIRWEKHRIKIMSGISQGKNHPSNFGGQQSESPLGQIHLGNGQTRARWTDCPGCPKCAPNDGLVLRRGSGRTTRSHSYIYMLTKRPTGYYYDSYAARERGNTRGAETMQDLPRTKAIDGFCIPSQSQDIPHGQMQKMSSGGAENTMSEAGSESLLQTILGESKGKSDSKEICEIGKGQNRQASLRVIRKGKGASSKVSILVEGTSDKIGFGEKISGGTSRGNESVLSNSEQTPVCKDKSEKILPETGKANHAPPMEQEIQRFSVGARKRPPSEYETKTPTRRTKQHTNAETVGTNQSDESKPLPLVWQDNKEITSRSCNSGQQGRSAYPGEYSSFLSGLQSQKGRENSDAILGANLRSVWSLSPDPLSHAHYAAFPRELARRCISIGTSEKGCCPKCGSQIARILGYMRTFESGSGRSGNKIGGKQCRAQGGGETLDVRRGPCLHNSTLGWRQTCSCPEAVNPTSSTVLDPFAGSGTVLIVARALGRNYVGIELSETYLKIIEARMKEQVGKLFADPDT